ncbi:MAG TPA: YibE/F family protein [Candidatus Paceibacterota bacterium]
MEKPLVALGLLASLALAVTAASFPVAHAQEIVEDKQEIVKARVIEIVDQKIEIIPGTDTSHMVQVLRAEVLEGEIKGSTIEMDNDYAELEAGDKFYLRRIVGWDGGSELYSVAEPYRTPALIWLTVLFIALTIIFGGKQGVRGLLSLFGSFLLIGFVLLPAMANGYSPVWVSIGVSSLIIILGSYVTHGFNKTTTAAVIGMIATVSFIGLFAHFSIHMAGLTGFESDESTYLHFNSRGTIDLAGLLLGGILIGLLGVMYDAAIGQSISVEELHRVAPHMTRKAIYLRAIRIGREHIGALVNTLAIAYVGASLPLLLLFYLSNESAAVIVNREIFSAEIVRSLVGSIGLILAVPVTTVVAVLMLIKNTGAKAASPDTLDKERHALEYAGHHHH